MTDIDAEFLPLIYDIVKCVERDPGDAAAKNKVNILTLFSFSSREPYTTVPPVLRSRSRYFLVEAGAGVKVRVWLHLR